MSPQRTPPTPNSSRATSPYPSHTLRVPSQSKSRKREQFSACGACRMRRVRCDLKDLPISSTGHHSPCSNCKERGLKCVDEFAEVKAVKLLRRGRRLQQVEAVYGKTTPDDTSLYSVTPPPSVIPRMRPEFLHSPFFRRFNIQRPILEPIEFRTRFTEYSNGNVHALSIPGQLIALALVVWAASYGVDECGQEDAHMYQSDLQQRNENMNDMLQEMLYLVDLHGILRKPCWDGARLLLLLLPLTQEIQTPVERLAMHEATLGQIYTLCSLAPAPPLSTHGPYIDALARARIYWYAHVLDGVTSGLRGGRVLLHEDDLRAFENTLPAQSDKSKAAAVYATNFRFVTVPIRISGVCREIHSALTGQRARRREDIDGKSLQYAWDTLDSCWKDLEGLRHYATENIIELEDVERFIDGWQIFIFECHTVIREGLNQRLLPQDAYAPNVDPRHMGRITRFHECARQLCWDVVQDVVTIIRRNLGTSFFQFDASLVRDGCFFAGFLLARESGTKEDIDVCLQALSEMRWGYSKSEERMQTVRLVWEARISHPHRQVQTHPHSPSSDTGATTPPDGYAHTRRHISRAVSVPSLAVLTFSPDPLSSSSSAPNTSYTDDGSWPPTLLTNPHMNSYPDMIPSHNGSPSLTTDSPHFLPSQVPTGIHSSPGAKTDFSALPSLTLPDSAHTIPPSLSRRVDATQEFYLPSFDYGGYGGSSSSSKEHVQTSSEGEITPSMTPYPTSHYAGDTTAFSSSSLRTDPSGVPLDTAPLADRNTSHFGPVYFP